MNANTYYFTLTKLKPGPGGRPTQVPDIDPAEVVSYAGTASDQANLPGYPNGTMLFCIATQPPLANPAWPGVTPATMGQVTSWLQRTGDPSPENAAGWLGDSA